MIKVLDFGLAKVFMDDEADLPPVDQSGCAAGNACLYESGADTGR